VNQVARYLAAIKAEYFRPQLRNEIIVTADTVVILDNQILNKPKDRDDAVGMLSRLSGKTHLVMTGVSIVSKEKEENFDETTAVTFEKLSSKAIEFYVDHFKPFDKAGAYGAQDGLREGFNPCSAEEKAFLKSIGKEHLMRQTPDDDRTPEQNVVIIAKISGSYFNVMGLPVHLVYQHLAAWG
jgi:septum formation protein